MHKRKAPMTGSVDIFDANEKKPFVHAYMITPSNTDESFQKGRF